MSGEAGKTRNNDGKPLKRSSSRSETAQREASPEPSSPKAFTPEISWSSGTSTHADRASSSTATHPFEEGDELDLALQLSLQLSPLEPSTSVAAHADKGKGISQEDVSSSEDIVTHEKVMKCTLDFEGTIYQSAVNKAEDFETPIPDVEKILNNQGFSEGPIFKSGEVQNNCQKWKFLKSCDSNNFTLIDRSIDEFTNVQLKRFCRIIIDNVESPSLRYVEGYIDPVIVNLPKLETPDEFEARNAPYYNRRD